jgi:hypothetical protein
MWPTILCRLFPRVRDYILRTGPLEVEEVVAVQFVPSQTVKLILTSSWMVSRPTALSDGVLPQTQGAYIRHNFRFIRRCIVELFDDRGNTAPPEVLVRRQGR